jgi:hypothetical protein
MTEKRVNTVWMWQDGVHTRGVNLEVDKGVLIWQEDMAAFGCVTIPAGQPVSDFMMNGAGRYATPPDDIVAEIRESIVTLDLQNKVPETNPDNDVL